MAYDNENTVILYRLMTTINTKKTFLQNFKKFKKKYFLDATHNDMFATHSVMFATHTVMFATVQSSTTL